MVKERVSVPPPCGKRRDVLAAHRPNRNVRFVVHVSSDMRTIARSLAGAIGAVLLLGTAAFADAASRCSRESWSVDGSPLVATLCVPAQRAAHVPVSETITRNGQSMSHALDIDVVNGVDVTRTVDTIPLSDVGSAKQLHLTIVYRNGEASVEHALILPGAVVLK